MYVFYNGVDIPQPSGYPFLTVGQRSLAKLVFDKDHFGETRTNLTPGYGLIVVDETHLPNQTPALDLARSFDSQQEIDTWGLKQFYCKPDNTIWRRANWVRRPGTYTPDPLSDVLVIISRSPERNNFETRLAIALARLQVIRQTPPANLAGLYIYVQDLAQIEQEILRFLARMTRPDDAPP